MSVGIRWSFVEMTHLLDDLFGEGAALSTHSDDRCGLDHIHCFGERGRNCGEEKERKRRRMKRKKRQKQKQNAIE
jgi:hypothetical protein